ncbi:unnamed protein product [Lymnaea stagnalis]|uniref:Protein quiver n=1 Tax=Lymnaea stagnalis TaxID=6523 RepID=A0AAV2I7R2_LYMST
MKASQHILACLILIAIAIKEGLSLTCYSCNSEVQKELCLTPSAQTPVIDCVGNQTMCRKIEQQIYYNGEDHTRVLRQCATRGNVGDCLERTGTYRYKSWYCNCNGNNCNASERVALSFSLTFGLILSVFGLRKLL